MRWLAGPCPRSTGPPPAVERCGLASLALIARSLPKTQSSPMDVSSSVSVLRGHGLASVVLPLGSKLLGDIVPATQGAGRGAIQPGVLHLFGRGIGKFEE